jgi:predicted ATP-grasp superfamily ATP-dependent carboligase
VSSSTTGPGVLLLGADYYGTLAAARCFGKHGIHVTMADESRRARALYSRHVSEKLVHPSLSQPQALVDWLVAWGEQNPGTLLYPPNDHLSWLFAAHGERLSKAFVTYSPSESSVITLLDKKRLHDACASADVGIEVPETHALGEAGADDPIADRLRYPVLLKPRTQVFLESGIKGFIVHDKAELATELARFRQLVAFNRVLTDRHPDIAEPMVQEYLTAAETCIFSVSGFVGKDGSIVARAAMKVLQRPRKVGIGLCFEGRAIEPVLVDKLSALCRKIGYHGTFESEFIVDGDRRLLIDFNPRFYSQMGFDIARGVPLPMMVWHAARGEQHELDGELARARAWKAKGSEVYCHKTMLDLVLALQGMSGQMSRDDVRRWRRWYAEHRATATDAVRDPDDPMPAVIDAASWAQHFAKHPRSFVRSFVLNR